MTDDDKSWKEKQQEYLRLYNHYLLVENAILGDIKEDLRKIKQITDLEKKYNSASSAWLRHSQNFAQATTHYNNGKLWELGVSSEDLSDYDKSVRELNDISTEILKKKLASQCSYCQRKGLTNPHFYLKGTEYEKVFCNKTCLNGYLASCDECGKSRHGANWQMTNQNNDKRFCSKECTNKHYALIYGNYQQRKKEITEKQSYLNNKKTNRERERERERDKNWEEIHLRKRENNSSLNCPQCHQSITSDTIWLEEKANDNLEFCSFNCCTNYYKINPYCSNCGNTNPYRNNKWTNWENLYKSYKLIAEYLEVSGKFIKKDYSQIFCSDECLVENSGINQILLSWNSQEHEKYVEWKRKREINLDQESKNQRIKESKNQRIKESKNQRIKESTDNLNSQINSLASEIKDLESNQTNQNLLNAKKEELEEIKKELNSQNVQTQNNSKLYLGIGLGILGGILIGLVLWLVFRNKKINND